jgi:hypothetical protein
MRIRVDRDLTQQSQVDHQAGVADRMAGHAVASAAHGHAESTSTCKADSRYHVGVVDRTHDQLGPRLNKSVERAPTTVEPNVRGPDDRPTVHRAELATVASSIYSKHPGTRRTCNATAPASSPI